jgi:flagellar basal body-associated protein FliL
MEENSQTQEVQTPQEAPASAPEVGFPLSQPKPKGKMNKWVIIIIGLLVLGGGGVFFFTRGAKEEGNLPSPTVSGTSTSTPAATPAATPADRSKIEIEIQNGTGISGEASYLQGALKNLGYSTIEVGNADEQDASATTVTYGKSVSESIKSEITKKLEEVYKEVDVKSSSTQSVDVLIITGLRKGATAKPSPTASPKASPTASPSASPSPSAT